MSQIAWRRIKQALAVGTALVVVATIVSFVVAKISFNELPYDFRRARLSAVEVRIRAFELDTGHLPRRLDDLIVTDGSQGWKGPYAKESNFHDKFGDIRYEPSVDIATEFRLYFRDARTGKLIVRVSP